MKIEHVAIWTYDLERLRRFYETYFNAVSGAKYINPNKKFESYFLSLDGGSRLELMKMSSIPKSKNDPVLQFTGIIHISFSVGSEEKVDELTERLRRDGYKIINSPRRTGDGYYESVVFDPDGNRIEITV